MGRQVRRVPLDFDWPLNKPGDGFVNPHYRPCPDPTCRAGLSPAGQWLSGIATLIAVAGDDGRDGGRRQARGGLWPHPWLHGVPFAPERDGELIGPPPEFAEFVVALTGEKPSLIFQEYPISRALRKAANLPDTWGYCATCGGHGDDPTSREAAEAWEPTEPPTGDGWQLWETVSEGSPVSPVFATKAAFAEWLKANGYTAMAQEWLLKDDGDGWIPSMVIQDGRRVI